VLIHQGYKTELHPNNKQKTLLLKNAGAARFAYNWGLNQKILAINAKVKIPNAIELHRRLVILKRIELNWMYEVSKCSPHEALRNLDIAFNRFFKKTSKFPKFKNKKNGIGSFRLNGTIKIFDNYVQLPRLGKLKLKEKGYLPTKDIKVLSATISERTGHWFVSIQVEQKQPEYIGQKDEHDVVGVDLGIKTLATVSDGTTYKNPKPLKIKLRKLKKLNQAVSRKVKGSQNRKKAISKVIKLYYKISNIRKDCLHKMTTILAKNKRIIGIEDLNVSGMLKNHKLARSIADLGLGEWRRQLEYKGKWYSCLIKIINRWFPSSKTCHICGEINENLTLADREWNCSGCGIRHDRDYNASCNLEYVAASLSET
jgi:putative transposase